MTLASITAVRAFTSHAELLQASDGDPWVRWALADSFDYEAYEHAGVAIVQRRGRRVGAWVGPLRPNSEQVELAGERARLVTALRAARDAGLLVRWEAVSISTPLEHGAAVEDVLNLADGGDWEWMWTTRVPDQAETTTPSLVVLDDRADADELTEFAHAHNPRVWTQIGEGAVVRWVGVRGMSGELLAVGGIEREASGAPHLTGILTAPSARGRGLGEVVSADLTRWGIEHHGVCTLGVYSDNDVARRLYERLGYRVARRWRSRRLA